MNKKNLLRRAVFLFSLMLILSCSKDDDTVREQEETYNTEVAVTDAPIDNANVQGAFVTITNVEINGKAVEGFQKTTVDLLALQKGTLQTLGNVQLESGTTSSIAFELDHDTDVDGQSPGSYILTASGEKKALASGTKRIVLNDMAEVREDFENRVVLDFDLRKLIVLEGETQDSYSFVSDSQFAASVRAVNEADAGVIKGKVTDAMETSDKIVVYAYEKGTYSTAEAEANASSDVRFQRAVNSSIVNEADGSYELHFLEEGDYELHFASFAQDAEGNAEYQGMLDVNLNADLASSIGSLLGLNLQARSSITVDVAVQGML